MTSDMPADVVLPKIRRSRKEGVNAYIVSLLEAEGTKERSNIIKAVVDNKGLEYRAAKLRVSMVLSCFKIYTKYDFDSTTLTVKKR
jgi:hypothetical protein